MLTIVLERLLGMSDQSTTIAIYRKRKKHCMGNITKIYVYVQP